MGWLFIYPSDKDQVSVVLCDATGRIRIANIETEEGTLSQECFVTSMLTQFDPYRDNARAALAVLKARRDRKILEWEMALKVQAAWRGRLAKVLVLAMRIVRVR